MSEFICFPSAQTVDTMQLCFAFIKVECMLPQREYTAREQMKNIYEMHAASFIEGRGSKVIHSGYSVYSVK